LEDFYKFFDKWSDKHYSSARCKPCHQEYKRESPTTPRNRKAEKLQLRYGLTYEQWEQMRLNEGHACMICGITENEIDKKLDVDHCHTSGKVRGILCNPCNNMIGHAKDAAARKKISDMGYAKGGMTASKRADGCCIKGKTRGKMV